MAHKTVQKTTLLGRPNKPLHSHCLGRRNHVTRAKLAINFVALVTTSAVVITIFILFLTKTGKDFVNLCSFNGTHTDTVLDLLQAVIKKLIRTRHHQKGEHKIKLSPREPDTSAHIRNPSKNLHLQMISGSYLALYNHPGLAVGHANKQ